MAKVNIKSEKITPFGGIYYASKAFMRFHLTKSSYAYAHDKNLKNILCLII